MSFNVLVTLNLPVGVMMRLSSITFFNLRVLSSTTTMADFWSLPFHTENQNSSPATLYSGCTTRFGPSPRLAHSAIGSTSKPLSRFFTSNTAMLWLIFGSGFNGASTHRLLDLG